MAQTAREPGSSHVTDSVASSHRPLPKASKLCVPRCKDPFTDRESRPRVLLADDDPDMREVLSQTLRDAGYEVVSADDGFGLLERLAYNQSEAGLLADVDIIVSDICMPLTSGFEVLRSLRQRDWATSIILISAFANDAVRAEAKRMGATTVLSKPFSLKDFVHAVQSVVPPAPR